VFGMVSVPMWIWAINTVFPYHFQSSPGQVLMLLAKSVLLPLAIGLLVRRFLPRFAPGLARLAGMFYKVALVVAIPVLLYIGAPVVLHAPLLGLLTVLVLTVACALLGHWAGGPDPDDRRTLALLAALGNPALALAIAVNSYPDAKPGALVIAYVLLRALCLLPYTLWNKRHHQPPRAHPAPAPA
jgi:BASS family bile acid:Na+ symporter